MLSWGSLESSGSGGIERLWTVSRRPAESGSYEKLCTQRHWAWRGLVLGLSGGHCVAHDLSPGASSWLWCGACRDGSSSEELFLPACQGLSLRPRGDTRPLSGWASSPPSSSLGSVYRSLGRQPDPVSAACSENRDKTK